MPSYDESQPLGLQRPGRALTGVMVGLFAIWLTFALAINWAEASDRLFLLLCGNTEKIAEGEIWRLFTAPLLHMPTGSPWHLISALMGLYFLGQSLEASWGGNRFLRFLAGASLIAYSTQVLFELVLPASVSSKLAGPYWFGALPAVQAIAIAWALSFKGRVVRLFFVLPITSRGLIIGVVAISLLYLVAGAVPASGHIATFAGMGAGWLLGAGTPSPLRRAYLKLRLRQLDREAQRVKRPANKNRARGFRVIEGGGAKSSERRNKGDRSLN